MDQFGIIHGTFMPQTPICCQLYNCKGQEEQKTVIHMHLPAFISSQVCILHVSHNPLTLATSTKDEGQTVYLTLIAIWHLWK